MLKKISVEHLRLGMHLHAFCGSWMDHPFWRNKFVISDEKDIALIFESMIKEVWIDASKGLDVHAGEASAEAEAQWVDTIVKLARTRRDFLAACTPGYYNNEGKPDARTERNSQFWRGPTVFIRLLDEWRKAGTLPGLDLTLQPATAG